MADTQSIWAGLIGGIMRLQGHLPLSWHRRLSRVVAFLVRDVFHYRTDVVYTNIARSFPDMGYDQVKATARHFYLHFAEVFSEMVWFGACRGDKGRERLHRSHIVEITNVDELNRLMTGHRQVVVLQSHTGNWELTGGILQYNYSDKELVLKPSHCCVTYANVHNGVWDKIMAKNRTAPIADTDFDGYVDFNHILRFALTHRDSPMLYAFITDQYPYWPSNSHVTFLNRDTTMMTGGASLAVKFDLPLVYLRFKEREGGYDVTLIPICESCKGQDPEELMREYYRLLEEDLREQPWNYLWTHKRFK